MKITYAIVVIGVVLSLLYFGQAVGDSLPKFVLKVDGVVMVSDPDIEHYNWNTHTIQVTPSAQERIDRTWPWPPKTKGIPKSFVIEISGTEVYSGHIYPLFQSSIPSGPLIQWPLRDRQSIEIVVLSSAARDLRCDVRILAALEALGVLAE